MSKEVNTGSSFTVITSVSVSVHPVTGSVYVYVIVWGPTPAVDALKVVPVTKVPL